MAAIPGKVFISLATEFMKTYSVEQWEYQRMDVKAKIQEMTSNLTKIKALVAAAEEMEIKEHNFFAWLSEMKSAIYDAEYVIDVFEYQRLKNEIDRWPENTTTEVSSWKVPRLPGMTSVSSSNLKQKTTNVVKRLLYADEERNDLLKIVRKFEVLVNDVDNFAILAQVHSSIQNQGVAADGGAESRETTSISVEHKLFGRNEEEKQLLKLLLQSSGVTSETARCFDVVSVVGVGGLGKTTLAQFAYNHQNLKDKFDVKAWVCVSTNFDIKSLTKHIIENAIIKKPDDYSSLDTLGRIQDVLMKGLESKRFLIVMDDVWEDLQQDKWERICVPFRNGKEGSKILVTSRNRDVAKAMGAEENRQINLSRLQSEDFWEFFCSCAFRKKKPENYQQLEQIGMEISLQLGGLPLAAKTVGGLLYADFNVDHWRDVLNSKKWKEDTKVIPALKLSYDHLPKHLKKCFAYCCLFPKDFKYKAKTLVDIWIGLDCVRPEDKNRRRLVDIQKAYINELVSRCLLDVYNTHDNTYMIHDLLHDLAEELVGDEVHRVEVTRSLPEKVSLSHFVRHLYVNSKTLSSLDLVLQKLHIAPKQLRSLLFYGNESAEEGKLTFSKESIQKLKGLRLFFYSNNNEIEGRKVYIWENLGDMQHLRCASLHFGHSFNECLVIPTSFWKLNQLEIFRPGFYQVENFNHLHKLVNLRHVNECHSYDKTNTCHMGHLKSLEVVPGNKFIVDRKAGNDIGQLGELNKIGGELTLEVHIKLDEAEARKANLNIKQYLTKLVINDLCDKQSNIVAKAIEALQPHQNLQELEILHCRSINITPEWLPLLSNLTTLELSHLPNLQGLPPDLGCHLLCLKKLKLCYLPSVKQIEVVVAREPVFPSLANVMLWNMENLEEWCPESSNQRSPKYFPELNNIKINECPKLLMRSSSLPNCTIFPFPLPNCSIRLIILVSGSYAYHEYAKCSAFNEFELIDEEEIKFQMVIDVNSLQPAAADDYNDPQISILFSRVKEIIFFQSNLRFLSQKFSSLETLIIDSNNELESLDDIAHHLPPANKFIIKECDNLRFLSAANNNLQTMLSSSHSLIIEDCRNLGSLVGHNIDNTDNLISIKTLTLIGCQRLKFLFLSTFFPSLETLVIKHCWELESLTDDSNQLPPSITTLIIKRCRKLRLPPTSLQMLSCIHTIQIEGCHQIESLVVPAAKHIKTFIIRYCRKLKSVSLPTQISFLEKLIIHKCWNLESLSSNELPPSKYAS